MDTIRIMSIGRSGVGKSTIGNILLVGKGKGQFSTSMASTSCTQTSKCRASASGDVEYVDVPGLPCTDQKNNAEFYDIIIDEAKKELNVILFVFKKGKDDGDAYEMAEVLFRELNKSNATKILVINDFNSYAFDEPPAEADYKDQINSIKKMTKIDFNNEIVVTGKTIPMKLTMVKNLVSGTKPLKSEHLRNFTELGKHVGELPSEIKNIDEEIRRKERKLNRYKNKSHFNDLVDLAGNTLGVFTGGAGILSLLSVPGAAPVGVAGALGSVAFKAFSWVRKAEKKRVRNEQKIAAAELNTLRQNKAEKEKAYKTAKKEFDDLRRVLKVQSTV